MEIRICLHSYINYKTTNICEQKTREGPSFMDEMVPSYVFALLGEIILWLMAAHIEW